MKEEDKKSLTLQDLEKAIEVINAFSSLYRKAQMAVKSLGREQGKFGGMLGKGTDPITAMLFGSMEGMIERKLEEMAEKKVRAMTGVAKGEEEVDEGDLEEAKAGLNVEQEE